MTWLWQDVRIGSRTIFKDRWFFLAAILALALGIGSTTAIFSVIYNVVLDPYPYRDGQHIFCPEVRELGTSRIANGMKIREFLDFRVWTQDFNSDPGVIGKTFELNGTPTTLVGVMPERFSW